MKKGLKKFMVGALSIMAVGVMAACGGGSSDTLVVATSANFPPFGYLAEGGGYAGVDMQLAALLAEELGMELEIQNMPFASVLVATQTGQADIALSAMTINDARRENMNFTTPYLVSGQVIITHVGNNSLDGMTAEQIINHLYGARMGAGTPANTGAIFAYNVIQADVVNFQGTALMAAGLSQGLEGIEYGILDHSVAATMIAEHENLKVVDVPLTREYYGIGVVLGDYELLDKLNEALHTILSDGRFDAVLAQYGLQQDMGR
ncbi:MAG: transporter substrate-binding domain-containing protein [Defluviitaleaceae bacterium]|nr:transporter substrate-binding domain-containing protein [Defluviitaleaceae bacterium]